VRGEGGKNLVGRWGCELDRKGGGWGRGRKEREGGTARKDLKGFTTLEKI
jgi:hypothetical protein